MTAFGLKPYLAVAALLSVFVTPAVAADMIGSEPVEVGSGPCAESAVLRHITSRFRYQVTHVPNLPDVRITEFSDIHERRYIPSGEDRPIARRYCGATVGLSDGDRREVWYLIEEGMGFATANSHSFIPHALLEADNIEFCVSGFDRWMVYNGACRVLR